MTSDGEKENNVDKDTNNFIFNNSIEVIRKCSKDIVDISWEPNLDKYKDNESNSTLPFVSIVMTDVSRNDSSTQTEPIIAQINCSIVDVNLSIGKDYTLEDFTSNETTELCIVSKRHRNDSLEDNGEVRPSKKTKCTGTSTPNCSTDNGPTDRTSLKSSDSSSRLSTGSEASFKSINSNSSYKIRKRRPKSESSLFKDALQRSRKNIFTSKHRYRNFL